MLLISTQMLVENAISPWGQSWERVFQDCPHGEIRHCAVHYLHGFMSLGKNEHFEFLTYTYKNNLD